MEDQFEKKQKSRAGLTVSEILDELEALDDNEINGVAIYTIPPLDGADTEQDSDESDDEHDGNLNHLGPKLLSTACEVLQENDEWDDSDDEPLEKLMRISYTSNRHTNASSNWWRKVEPVYKINTKCTIIPPSSEAQSCRTPTEFFELFFSEDILKHFAEQTNLYGLQKNTNIDVTLEEMKVFLGGLLLSGYAKYPDKRMYWSSKPDCPKLLCDSMRVKRFEQILRNFHLNDNHQADNEDRLHKLRPFISHLNASYLRHGGMDEYLSIDESMIPYYGKHYAKQFIRGKPIRFGFKNWALNSANGFMLQFDIYMGKTAESTPNGFGVGGDKVLDLLSRSNVPRNKGFKVFIDNYFTSVKLLRHLSSIGICCSGTIREGRTEKCSLRSIPIMKKEERGSVDHRFTNNGNILLTRWKDSSVVTIATNFDMNEMGSCKRFVKGRGEVSISQPKVVQRYNMGMGGVDKMDQLVAVYRTRMRQKKWWWPIFAYLLDASVVNAWLLMKKLHPNDATCASLLIFRRNLATSYLETYGTPSNRGSRTNKLTTDTRYDGRNHLIEYSKTDKRCGHCGKKTNFICCKCEKGLHPKECFKSYHTPSVPTAQCPL